MQVQHFIRFSQRHGRTRHSSQRRGFGASRRLAHLLLIVAMVAAMVAGLGACAGKGSTNDVRLAENASLPTSRWQLLGEGIYLLSGEFHPGQQPDGNSIVMVEGREALVFDTGRHAPHAMAIVSFLRQHNLQLRWIINSHWHLDHSGGNRLLRDAFPDAQLISGRGVLTAEQGFLARYRQSLLQRQQQADIGEAAREANRLELARIDDSAARLPHRFVEAPPRNTVAAPASSQVPEQVSPEAAERLSLGGRELHLHVATHAASETDIWLLDVRTGTVLAGDLLTLPVPFLDTACPQIWWQVLQDMNAQPYTLAIPGHGPAMSRKGVAAYAQAFAQLQRCAASPAGNRACADAWLQALAPPFDEMSETYVRQLLDYYLDQHLRPGSNQVSHCPTPS